MWIIYQSSTNWLQFLLSLSIVYQSFANQPHPFLLHTLTMLFLWLIIILWFLVPMFYQLSIWLSLDLTKNQFSNNSVPGLEIFQYLPVYHGIGNDIQEVPSWGPRVLNLHRVLGPNKVLDSLIVLDPVLVRSWLLIGCPRSWV